MSAVLISWFMKNWVSVLGVCIAVLSLSVSLTTAWMSLLSPFAPKGVVADLIHLTAQLAGSPYRMLYVPLSFENRGARPGRVENLYLEAKLPDARKVIFTAFTGRDHIKKPPGKGADYLTGDAIFPQVFLPGRTQQIVGVLFRPARPEMANWVIEGDTEVTINAKADNVLWYQEIGQFKLRFSKQLLKAISDTAGHTNTAFILDDINRGELLEKKLGVKGRMDSFVAIGGDDPNLESVNSLFPIGQRR